MRKNVILLIALFAGNYMFSALSVPIQSAPTNGATDQYPDVMLDYSTITGASSYEIRIGTDPGMTVYNVFPSLSSYYYTSGLKFGTTYYWQVRAISTAPDSSDWSAVWSFSTRDIVMQVAPINGSVDQNPNVQIDWATFSGITYYEYELDTANTFDSPLYQTGMTGVTSYYYTSSLRYGTKYYWRVRAGHCCDTTQWSTIWDFTTRDQVTLASPSNGATNQYPSVQIDWTAVSGSTGYIYELDTSGNFDSPMIVSGTTSSSYYNNSNLLFGEIYYWRVKAINLNDTSEWSVVWNFTTRNNITQVSPSNGAVNQTPNVQIDWSTVSGASSYQYEIDTVDTFDSPLYMAGNTSSSYYNTSNLRYGDIYYWRVRAMHVTDTTLWSSVWNFTTIDIVSLVAPSNGAIDQDPNVQLDWTGISGSTGYEYELDTVNTFDSPYYQSGTVSVSNYNTSNLLFGKTFYWRVRAYNTNDTSSWSVVWNFSTQNMLTHTSPADGSVGQAPNVTIDWSYMSGLTNYDYEIDTSFNFNSPLYEYHSITGSSSQASLSNLRFGTKYWWRVRARHSLDTTEWTDAWALTTTDMLTNTSPADGSINQAPNTVIDWSYLSGIIYYDYELDTTPNFNSPLHGIYTVSNSSSQATLSNLMFGETYYWRARARHNVDTTQWSNTWAFSTVSGVNLVSPTDGAVDISLNPTIDWSYLSGITNYHYQYDTDPNFTAPNYFSIGSSSSQANLSNLSYGEVYYWQVRAAHGADTSDWTAPWQFTTLFQLTTAPVLSSPADGSTGITLPANIAWLTYSGATYYEYQLDTSVNFTNPISGNTANLSESIAGLVYGETYYWRVRANNGSGFSPWSNIWSFTVGSIGIPNLISPADGATGIAVSSVMLDWSDVPSVISYEYEYSKDAGFTIGIFSGNPASSDVIITGLDYSSTYYWRVRAYDGIAYSMWSSVWSFDTELTPMDQVVLNLPVNGAGIQPVNNLYFEWNGVQSADQYDLEYSPDPGMTFGVLSVSTADTFATINGLDYNMQYYWRVRALEAPSNYGLWSNIWSFTTESDPFGAPILVSPADGAVDQLYDNLLLDWSDVVNAVSYEYQYSTDSLFATYSAGNVNPSEAVVNGLQYLTRYYWRVRAYNGSSLSDWSDTLSFKTQDDVTGISVEISNEIKVFPNPVSHVLNIHSDMQEIVLIELLDVKGEVIYKNNSAMYNYQMDVSKYARGVYILKVQTINSVSIIKLNIRH